MTLHLPRPGAPWDGNPPLNLARWCLERHAEDPAAAGRPAFSFVHEGGTTESWTYAQLWERVQRLARGLLDGGLEPGDRILIRLPHSPDYAFAFLGATLAGMVPIPASPALTPEEAAFLAEDAQAAAMITTWDLRLPDFAGATLLPGDLDLLDGPGPLPETRAEDPAFLIYTSGTTDRPKGAVHAHRTVHGRAMMREGWQDFRPTDTTLHAGTLNWSYTLGVGLMDPWAAGAHAVLAGGTSSPDRWPALIRDLGVTVFVAVPTVYRQMLKYAHPDDVDALATGSLRHVLCAGEPLSPTLLAEWTERAGTPMYESLGMTEVSTYISSGPHTPTRPGSPGRPQPGRRVAILPVDEAGGTTPLPAGEIGLLAVHRSDPGLMLGYWRRPDEEAAVVRGEWFVGGDLASLDADGYLWFHGRADDIIKSFGYRLSPVEIEHAIETFPAVSEAAVIAHRVDEMKTLVTACLVPRDGHTLDASALASLRAHVERHLAEYKRPHEYVVVESLPRTRNGKLLRRALVEQVAAQSSGGGRG